jgi:hypothetical protein
VVEKKRSGNNEGWVCEREINQHLMSQMKKRSLKKELFICAYNVWDQKKKTTKKERAKHIFLRYRDKHQNNQLHRVPMAHPCNPSYSGGRYQEAQGLKPATVLEAPS